MIKTSILIIEDDSITAFTITEQLKRLEYDVLKSFSSAEDALEFLNQPLDKIPDIILVDIQLEGSMSGIDAAKEISNKYDCIVIFLTNSVGDDIFKKAIETKPYGYLVKPVDFNQLKIAILLAVNQKKLEDTLKDRQKELEIEINAHKETSKALTASESRYRLVLEEQTDMICRFDIDGVITFANKAFCSVFENKERKVMGLPITIRASEEDAFNIKTYLNAFSRSHPESSTEHRYILDNGTYKCFHWLDRAVFDHSGKIVEFQSTGRDITDRKNAEHLMCVQRDLAVILSSTIDLNEVLERMLNATLKLGLFDSGGVYLIQQDNGDLKLFCHKGLSHQFISQVKCYKEKDRYAKIVQKGKPFYLNIHQETENVDRLAEEGLKFFAIIPIIYEKKVIGSLNIGSHTHVIIPDIQRRTIEAIASQIGGAIIRTFSSMALRESRENFQTLFDAIEDFIIITQHNGQIIITNPIVTKRLDYSENDIVLKNYAALHPGELVVDVQKSMADAFSGNTSTIRTKLLTSHGLNIPVETKMTKGRWNGIDVLYNISRDITEQVKVEKAIIAAKDVAESANFAKTEFVANMSHEFRTPMQAILHCSKSGIRKIDQLSKERIVDYFRYIQEAGERLMPLLNDLLDLSRLESGKHVYQFKVKNIEPAVNISILELNEIIHKKNLSIELDIEKPNLRAYFDQDRIVQVLQNLLSNAIRVSPENSNVLIRIKAINNEKEVPDLKISVIDQGVGIPEGEQKIIFEKFALSSNMRSGSGGIGLGLSICKTIISDHGGEIWAENNENCGATFHFILRGSSSQVRTFSTGEKHTNGK